MNESNGTPLDTYERRVKELEAENGRLKDEVENHRQWAEDVWNDPAKEPLKILLQKNAVLIVRVRVLSEALGRIHKFAQEQILATNSVIHQANYRTIRDLAALEAKGGSDAKDD